jgi:hypothetical protein
MAPGPIRDKALAMEHYMRQASNKEAEHQAIRIRLRAERKLGKMLKKMAQSGERAGSGRPKEKPSQPVIVSDSEEPQTLMDMGISLNQSAKWQKVAEVPEEEFEELLDKRIRLRAERRVGQMLKDQRKNGERAGPGQGRHRKQRCHDGTFAEAGSSATVKADPKTLADMGIKKKQSSNWQGMAEVPEEKFEEILDKRIRLRAERRVGQMLKDQRKDRERALGGRPKKNDSDDQRSLEGGPDSQGSSDAAPQETRQTLADIGINYNQSSNWQGMVKRGERAASRTGEACTKNVPWRELFGKGVAKRAGYLLKSIGCSIETARKLFTGLFLCLTA